MKLLLGVLSCVLVPSLLVVPAGSPSAAAPAPAVVVQKVTADDIAARARRVIGLADRRRLDELERLATPETAEFLVDRLNWVDATPQCKRSVASRPGDPVWACRITEYHSVGARWEPVRWWLYFRQVEGVWTAVNKRLATSLKGYRTGRNLEARTDKIMDAAWAEDWSVVEPYLSSALLAELTSDIESSKDPMAEGEFDEERSGGLCRQVRPAHVEAFGRYYCGWLVSDAEYSKYVRYRLIDERWVAHSTVDVVW